MECNENLDISIKIADNGIEKLSTVNGPGLRYTIFTQGCDHDCYACHNPETHNFDIAGEYHKITDICADILRYVDYISGVTFSGGDPLYIRNYNGVLSLCKLLKRYKINIWLYTGYLWEDLKELEIIKYIDILVDGEFMYNQKSYDLKFKGSKNQRIIDVQKSISENKIIEWIENN